MNRERFCKVKLRYNKGSSFEKLDEVVVLSSRVLSSDLKGKKKRKERDWG